MGFRLMTNFKSPYLSKSVSEFWSRWHISLSSWFTDYLYIPLGGNRVSVPRWYFNIFFVFLISGLWHGANWTFILWGGHNGLYLIFSILLKKIKWPFVISSVGFARVRFQKITNIAITFLLITFSWIFFRANSSGDAILIIRKMVAVKGPLFAPEPYMVLYPLLGIAVLLAIEISDHLNHTNLGLLSHKNVVVRYSTYLFLSVLILIIGVFDGGQFIYFQF